MPTHSFITTWLMAPGKKPDGDSKIVGLGEDWGFRGQTYDRIKGFKQVMKANYTYGGGNSVGISPRAEGTAWSKPFKTENSLWYCAFYWWEGAWLGGFVDWWPVTGGRTTRPAPDVFKKAIAYGIKKFAFAITNGSSLRTNIQAVTI